MINLRSLFFVTTIIGFLYGCTAPISKADRDNVRTIGVLNSFPENPTWTRIGATVFTNKFSTAEARGYKALLSKTTIDYLKNKGYVVKELTDKNSIPDGDINFRIELSPWDAEQYVGTKGYGFVQRSIMGIFKKGPFAYVVMHINPSIKQGDSFNELNQNSQYNEQFEVLPISDMPSTWGELSISQQTELEKSLKICVEKSLKVLLPELGL
jgi:hypothetical protein